MQIRVLVNGATGKMGSQACTTLDKHPDFDLVARLNRNDELQNAIKSTHAQVVVDLTRADSVYENSRVIIDSGAHPVIGTSGLLAEQIEELTAICERKKLGGIIAPNFSIGAVLMMMFAEKAAQYLPEVEIIEAHHQHKLDAPSGTALKTAELIAAARRHERKQFALKELIPGSRGGTYANVPIHSLRLPGVLARQEVLFGAIGETLSITHNTIDRECFMPGIVLACQKVVGLHQLIYGLESLLS